MLAMKAAKEKKDVLCTNQYVRFYNDMATEVHRQRRKYDWDSHNTPSQTGRNL